MLDVDELRNEFPAFAGPQIFLDGPAGTQTPRRVIEAVSGAMATSMSNVGGDFPSSYRSSDLVNIARQAGADLTGGSLEEIVFGANMTSLTFALSRALAEEWQEGDRIVLSALDHDANVTPWVLAARSRGVEIVFAELGADASLDLDHLESLIDDRTRLVAVTGCSNAFGSLVDVGRVAATAARVGALSYIDAVHLAPHRYLDVGAIGCDFLVCSAYKFFGPHLGILWGRRSHLSRLPAFKVRPAPDVGPARWETGTPPFELLAGFVAAVDYLASLGWGGDRRGALESAFREIREQESLLGERFLAGLGDNVTLVGPPSMEGRVSTFAVDLAGVPAPEVQKRLGELGIATWAGHYYAVEPMRRLGFLDRGGLVRIGFLHINTPAEVDAVLDGLAQIAGAA
ncbi:MAG TPA: cysteine desulfurase-like protein [Acidimicrobiia bacterium]|nr:cysteine desulfurase-like protein [Acidimicrobiia bacterium]